MDGVDFVHLSHVASQHGFVLEHLVARRARKLLQPPLPVHVVHMSAKQNSLELGTPKSQKANCRLLVTRSVNKTIARLCPNISFTIRENFSPQGSDFTA